MRRIKPIKCMGQNFLQDERALRRIVDAAGISGDDIALEIGTGTGNLTKYLCQNAKFVYSVEKDARLCKIAGENLREFENVKIINDDILRVIASLTAFARNDVGGRLKIIGNLPYYITTPIIFKLLEYREYIKDITIMVQKEVAERIAAKPGGKDYGILSCSVQFYTKPEILFNVSKSVFRPQPKVDSSVLRLKILQQPPVSVKDEKLFFKIIKAAFGKRRKMLRSSLAGIIAKDKLADILAKSGIDERCRAETLSLAEFAKILDHSNLRGWDGNVI